MQPTRRLSNIKRVCIVGGGPAGVAAAKHLLAERCFDKIDIYDQRSETGGVWCYEPENDRLNQCPVPHTNPEVPLEQPQWLGNNPSRATYQSPMYARLEANLPKMLMQHSDLDFPKHTQLFPRRKEILDYLDQYALNVKRMIRPESQVTFVEKVYGSRSTWSVTTRDLRYGRRETRQYDAVVISSGHYTVPFIPPYEGIKEFNARNCGIISHAKWFDDPTNFSGKKVLIVGMGPSGSDIATQIAEYCSSPILISTRSQPSSLPPKAKHLPAISCFDSERRSLRFVDGNIVENLDHIVFCTGYIYSYPFLADDIRYSLIYPPSDHPKAFYPGERCRNVYQHLFYVADPTLSFLTLPWNIIPFPVAEGQGAVVARVLSSRLSIPSETEMRQWERQREHEVGLGKIFHKLAPPTDVDYINHLWHWAHQAREMNNADGQVISSGKTPPYWNSYYRWMRKNVPNFKRDFAEKGEERHHVTTLEELGFHYEDEARK